MAGTGLVGGQMSGLTHLEHASKEVAPLVTERVPDGHLVQLESLPAFTQCNQCKSICILTEECTRNIT